MTRLAAPIRVAIVATGSLARSGLRRIIAEADLDLVDDGRTPDIVVYDDVGRPVGGVQ